MKPDQMIGVDQSKSLEHYGRKGQKWGVRNGPPYPLDEEKTKDYNKDVDDSYNKKLGRHMNRKNKLEWGDEEEQKEFKKIKKSIVTENFEDLAKHEGERTEEELMTARFEINHRDSRANDSNNFYLGRSYNCPNCAVAFDMVERGYDVTAKPADYGSNVGDIARFYEDGKLEKATGKYSWYTVPKSKHNDMLDKSRRLDDEFRERCNAALGDIDFRSLSYDDQMKIYDEKLKSLGDEYESRRKEIFAPLDRMDRERQRANQTAVDNMEKKLQSYGNGARGIIVVGWPKDYYYTPNEKATSFHAFNWINEDGTIIYYDAQSRHDWKYGKGYTKGYFTFDINPNELYTMRTDTLQLSPSVVEAVNSRRR